MTASDVPSSDGDDEGVRVLDPRLRAGRAIDDRYALIERIGRGGMGVVWSAFDTKLTRNVAIKLMGHGYARSARYRKRFEQEATAAMMLRSAHVVHVFGSGLEGDVPYIVMELLTGEDLFKRVEREGRLSMVTTESIVVQAAKALTRAHAACIIHRDLKPQNLFLVDEPGGPSGDEAELVKLLDFGVAKVVGGAELMTTTGVMLGSAFYMSPEQITTDDDVDWRSDLWSLAAIAYRCLTGRRPFEGEVTKVLFEIAHRRPPKASSLVKSLPASVSVDAFFDKAFMPARKKRYQSASELAMAFRQAIADG